MQWIFLGVAILMEVIATSTLKATEGFTKLIPSVVVILGYALSFYVFSFALKTIPLGVAYAIWAGIGIVLVSLTGIIIYKQHLDLPALLGILMIIAGVLIIRLFSKSLGK
jgi:small multidrug resistance pump